MRDKEEERIFAIGTSGFSYHDWKFRFYPASLKRQQWLQFYSQYLSSVEINATFYRIPTIEMLQKWYALTPENFIFSLKMLRTVTHRYRLHCVEHDVLQFCEYHLQHLRKKFKAVLFQMPPGFPFSSENFRRLLSIHQRIQDEFRTAVLDVYEFRHRSWFDPNVIKAGKQEGVIFSSVSSPITGNVAICDEKMYIRFHGLRRWYNDQYTPQELSWWIQKIRQATVRCLFAYFNNTVNAFALRDAQLFTELLFTAGAK